MVKGERFDYFGFFGNAWIDLSIEISLFLKMNLFIYENFEKIVAKLRKYL